MVPVYVDPVVAWHLLRQQEFDVNIGVLKVQFGDDMILLLWRVEKIIPFWTDQLIFSPAMLKNKWFPFSSRSTVAPLGGGTGSLLWSGWKSECAQTTASVSSNTGVIRPPPR